MAMIGLNTRWGNSMGIEIDMELIAKRKSMYVRPKYFAVRNMVECSVSLWCGIYVSSNASMPDLSLILQLIDNLDN